MRVLVGCEFSGVVRDAFRDYGHDAWSCDLLPCERGGPHITGDLLSVASWGCWDVMIAHPPCTYLTLAANRWWNEPGRPEAAQEAVDFILKLWNMPIPRVAIENPIGRLSGMWRKPDQIVQPWMFGHGETKATCLWLKNLPPLMATVVDTGREARVHRATPGPERWKFRSRTLDGVAAAMAFQWG